MCVLGCRGGLEDLGELGGHGGLIYVWSGVGDDVDVVIPQR